MDMNDYTRTASFCVGIDVGQASDPTAVAVVECIVWSLAEHAEQRVWQLDGVRRTGRWGPHHRALKDAMPKPEYRVRHLERLQLGMPYPTQAARLADMLARVPDAKVFLDAGGVGRPVSDLFRDAGVRHTPVIITGGRDVTQKNGFVGVPKLELISRLQAALHAGQLKIARELADAQAFVKELQEFRLQWSEAGSALFGARQGAHDDLVIAAALAVWGARRGPAPGLTRELAETMRQYMPWL